MAKITVMFGADPQGDFTLNQDEMRVGRATDCEIVVDNLGVSRHHCSIVRDGDNWAVVDKGSNNGTFVGGQRITKHTLKHGERVIMGKHSLIYDAHGSADPNDKKKTVAGMGGEMTMFVDQSALAKAMASGEAGAANAALFAVSMLALSDANIARKLEEFRERQTKAVLASKLPE